jgi:hypothetical protein
MLYLSILSIFREDLNIRIHRDITGEKWFGVGWFFLTYL